eukprot:342810_1
MSNQKKRNFNETTHNSDTAPSVKKRKLNDATTDNIKPNDTNTSSRTTLNLSIQSLHIKLSHSDEYNGMFIEIKSINGSWFTYHYYDNNGKNVSIKHLKQKIYEKNNIPIINQIICFYSGDENDQHGIICNDDNVLISSLLPGKILLIIAENVDKALTNDIYFNVITSQINYNTFLSYKHPIFIRTERDLTQFFFVYLNKSIQSQIAVTDSDINPSKYILCCKGRAYGTQLNWNETLSEQSIKPETYLYLLSTEPCLLYIGCAYFHPNPIMFHICKSWNIQQIKQAFLGRYIYPNIGNKFLLCDIKR